MHDTMELLRARLQITDIEDSLDFFRDKLGLVEITRMEANKERGTRIFLAAPEEAERAKSDDAPLLELFCERDKAAGPPEFGEGYVAYRVEDLYWLCHYLMNQGITIDRPPRDGRMALVRSPDGHLIELRQQGNPREPMEPWVSMRDHGDW